MPGEPLRFVDILTNASAVARHRGAQHVSAVDLLDAIAVLGGEKRLEDLGRPVSPLVFRASQTNLDVEPAVRDLVGRWFERLGQDPNAELDEPSLEALREELIQLSHR